MNVQLWTLTSPLTPLHLEILADSSETLVHLKIWWTVHEIWPAQIAPCEGNTFIQFDVAKAYNLE